MIGTTSTEAKAAKARESGADDVILYSQKDFVEEVNRITDGKGVNVIYDGVGKTTLHRGTGLSNSSLLCTIALDRQGYRSFRYKVFSTQVYSVEA